MRERKATLARKGSRVVLIRINPSPIVLGGVGHSPLDARGKPSDRVLADRLGERAREEHAPDDRHGVGQAQDVSVSPSADVRNRSERAEAASGATHVLTLYALRDSLQLSDLDVLLVRGSLTSTIMGKVLACCTSPRRPQSASSTAEERQLLPRLPGAVA